jgi:PAS domain S-box-containing protein
MRRRDGRLLWVQVSKRLVVDGDLSGGIIASYVNVDGRHRAEQTVALQAERTRAILDSVLVGIVTVGPNGIEWMNRSARRMFGGDLADFLEHPISTVATPEAEHPFRQTHYLDSLVEGQAETFECRVKARDGREFWVVGNVVATGRQAGRQLTYALLDIERRRQAEARTAQVQASLQRIIEVAPMAITLRDATSLRILQVNEVAARSLGRTAAELVGCTPEETYELPIAAQRRLDMEQALASRRLTHFEYKVGEAGGPARFWDARYLPLASPGQPPDQLLLVATDVTEQRAAQEARLEAAVTQREMLVKEVHHRIKNNLQGVAGLLQQIATRKPEVASAISEVVGQVQAIAQVYGLQVGVSGPLRLKSVIEAITGSVQRTFGHPILLTVSGSAPHLWALPEAESIPIALTVNELLTNAVKHSMAGRGLQVSVQLASEDDGVQILIANRAQLPPDFNLARLPGAVSGLGLVRALLPRRSASLSLEQRGEDVVATVRLSPPGISKLDPM